MRLLAYNLAGLMTAQSVAVLTISSEQDAAKWNHRLGKAFAGQVAPGSGFVSFDFEMINHLPCPRTPPRVRGLRAYINISVKTRTSESSLFTSLPELTYYEII
eukprot:209271-Rhodomonas_salina.4